MTILIVYCLLYSHTHSDSHTQTRVIVIHWYSITNTWSWWSPS